MKSIAAFFICILVMCLFIGGQSEDCPARPELGETSSATQGTIRDYECIRSICTPSGRWVLAECGLKGECLNPKGITEKDLSKPFPDCCPQPICE